MYFPSNFPVCGVGLVRNSVDELFVEGTCNVFGVDVCVVLESYGVVLLWWSFFLIGRILLHKNSFTYITIYIIYSLPSSNTMSSN